MSIQHPAWAHQFKLILNMLKERGDDVIVLAIDKDGDLELLKKFGIPYILLGNSTGRNVLEKGWIFFKTCVTYSWQAIRYKPDILIGRASPMMAVAAFVMRRPHLIFEDTEVSRFSLNICKKLSARIITPMAFQADLGSKQYRMPIYKELFYLHPNYFTPDAEVLEHFSIAQNEQFVILRFVAWNASHDIGKSGLTEKQKLGFVRELSQYAKVYVSSEQELTPELEPYRLRIPYEQIHHVLYYAQLVISEGATMASEAAVVGTHALYLNEISSGTTQEQQEKYHLLFALHDPATRYEEGLKLAVLLLAEQNLWEDGKQKRQKLLQDMEEPNALFIRMMDELVKGSGYALDE